MKKRRRYDLKIKSTKKQKIALGVSLGSCFLLYIIFLFIDEPADWISITFLILMFASLITGMVVILTDNSKEVKKAKKIQDEEYEISIANDKKVEKYLQEFFNSDIDLNNIEEKKKLIIMGLLFASFKKSTTYFYVACSEIPMSEIKEILEDFKVTNKLRKFLNDVIYQYKETNEIIKYEYELNNYIENMLIDAPIDEKLYDDNIYYNNIGVLRSYYEYNEKKNKYEVIAEGFNNYYGFYKWVEFPSRWTFSTKEKAIEKCKNIVNKYSFRLFEFTQPVDIDIKSYKEKLLDYLGGKYKLEEPYQSLADYFHNAYKYGNLAYFEVNDSEMLNILRRLEGLIPEELLDIVVRAYNFKSNNDLIKKADTYLNDFKADIQETLNQYATTLNPIILQDLYNKGNNE